MLFEASFPFSGFPVFFVVTLRPSRLKKQSNFSRVLLSWTASQLFCCFKRMESYEHPVYRLCLVTFPGLLEIVDYESKWAKGQIHNEFPKTKGSWSYIIQTTMLELLKSFTGNISLNVENQFGTRKKDGTLTGCYRSVRDNQSDFSLIVQDFPTIDYEKVDPYQVLAEYSLKIMSGYYSETDPDVSFNDFILTSIQSFDNQTWFAVLVVVSAFFGLWMTKRALFPDNNHVSLRRRIAEALWDTLLLFISQESTDYDKFLDRLLSILMTVSFFFLTTVYFGFMSTDLVTVTKPTVINSYQDIMNRPNITPVFVAVTSDHQEFEDAYEDDDDSIQAKFWAKYRDKVEMADPNSNLAEMITTMEQALEFKKVLILNGIATDGARRVICRLKTGYQIHENVYTWISRDPNARMHKKGWIIRNGMKQTRFLKSIRRKMRTLFETGIIHGLIEALTRDGLKSSDQFTFPEGPHSQVEKCLSDKIVYADASVDTVVMQNFDLLFVVSVVMVPASIIALLVEFFYKRN